MKKRKRILANDKRRIFRIWKRHRSGKYKERLIMEKDKNGFFEIRQCEECKKEVANGKVE